MIEPSAAELAIAVGLSIAVFGMILGTAEESISVGVLAALVVLLPTLLFSKRWSRR